MVDSWFVLKDPTERGPPLADPLTVKLPVLSAVVKVAEPCPIIDTVDTCKVLKDWSVIGPPVAWPPEPPDPPILKEPVLKDPLKVAWIPRTDVVEIVFVLNTGNVIEFND